MFYGYRHDKNKVYFYIGGGKTCLIIDYEAIQRQIHLLVILYVWSISHFPLAVCSVRSVRSSPAQEVWTEGWRTLFSSPNLGFPHCEPLSIIRT